jgi:DNA primase small subunit
MPHSDPPAAEENSAPSSATQMEGQGPSASSPSAEEDIVMTEADEVRGAAPDTKPPSVEPPPARTAQADEDMMEIKQETKSNVKLEDLFAGMDSDEDEFPGSSNNLNEQEQA